MPSDDAGQNLKGHFRQIYNKLENDGEWRLESSGNGSEDIIFNCSNNEADERMFAAFPMSWIIPLYDD